jgi:hypothetical protein
VTGYVSPERNSRKHNLNMSLCFIIWAPRYNDMREWRYSSTILNLGTRWRWVVSFKPLQLYPQGNRRRYPLNRTVDEPQSRSGRCGEEKISCSFRETNPGRPTRSPSLYRLSYPRIVLEWLERNTKTQNLDSRCPSRDSNWTPPEYETRTLPLCQIVRWFHSVLLRSNRLKYVKQFIIRSIPHTGEYHE